MFRARLLGYLVFAAFVSAQNPVINTISDQSIDMNAQSHAVLLTISNLNPGPVIQVVETPNLGLIDPASISTVVVTSPYLYVLGFRPATGKSGTTTILVTVQDSVNLKTATTTFSITIRPNAPPAIDNISSRTVLQNSGIGVVRLTGINQGLGQNGLPESNQYVRSITATTSNPSLIGYLVSDWTPGSTSSVSTLIFEPTAGRHGSAEITVTVTDSLSAQTVKTFTITVNPLPVDCQYTYLGAFSLCSASCGGGKQTRQAQITQIAENGGRDCPSPLPVQEVACNTSPCAVDCELEWGPWSECSRGGNQPGCGTGVKFRTVKSHFNLLRRR